MNFGVFLYNNETLEVPSQVVRDDFVAGGREESNKLTHTPASPMPGCKDFRVKKMTILDPF